jgi:hypothetical protein
MKIFTGKALLYIGDDESFRQQRCQVCETEIPVRAIVGVQNIRAASEDFGKWHVFCGIRIVWMSEEQIMGDFAEVNGG